MSEMTTTGATFTEVQRLRRSWVWVLILLTAVIIWVLTAMQFLMPEVAGEKFMPDFAMIIFFVLFGLGFPAVFLFGNLKTEVRGDGIYVRFFPFHRSAQRFPFNQIRHCEARTYSAIKEYGGWGIKCGKSGKAYNMSGDRGVQLEFTDGKRLLIGSQRADELSSAINARLR